MASRVHIERVEDDLLADLRYLNAAPRRGMEISHLPILRAHASAPFGGLLDAIVVCSDLQGIVRGRGDEAVLLGVAAAELLEDLASEGALPPCPRIGAILAGDLYSVPAANKRGGFGDVSEVWRAFAERFAWVAGVAGNHDDVSAVTGFGDHVHLLDGDVVDVDGLRVGGVGGIVSEKHRPWCRSEHEQLSRLERAIDAGPDILVLHEGPEGDADQRGNPTIGTLLETGGVGFTICGHSHWPTPLATHDHGQILNVDARVVVILAPRG